MALEDIATLQELRDAIDVYFKTPKFPGVKGAEANIIFKKIVDIARKQTKTYNTIALRDADTDVENGNYAFVIDATADVDIPDTPVVAALYFRNNNAWSRVSIIDNIGVVLDWVNITNKPTSTPAAIDNAVAKVKFTTGLTVNFPNNTTGLPNGTVINAGDEIEGKFRQMLRKAAPPTYVEPTVILESSPTENNIEAGTIIDILLDSTFTQNDGGASTSVSIKRDNVEIATAEPYTNAAVQITETPKVYQATYVHAAGPVKNDSLGNPDATGQISAGSKNTNTKTYTGYRNAFVGFIAATSSAIIRAFTNKLLNAVDGSVLLVTIPAGAARVVITYKATNRDLNKVEYVEDSNKNITGNFVKLADINVEGANAFTAIAYKRFEFIPVEPFPSAVTYRFTI